MTHYFKNMIHHINIKFGVKHNIKLNETDTIEIETMDQFSQCFVASMNITADNIDNFMKSLLKHVQNDNDYQDDSLIFVKSALSIANNTELNYSSNKNDTKTQQELQSYLNKFTSDNFDDFDILHVFKILFTRYGMSNHALSIDSGMTRVLDYFNSQVDYVNNDDNYNIRLSHLTQADLDNIPLISAYGTIFYQRNHQLDITKHFSSSNDLLDYDDTDDSTLVSAMLYVRGYNDQLFSILNGASNYYTAFQKDAGLPQTGLLDKQTLFKIFDPSFNPRVVNSNKFRAFVHDTIVDKFKTNSFEISNDLPDPIVITSNIPNITNISFYYDIDVNPNVSSVSSENQPDNSDINYVSGKLKVSNFKAVSLSVNDALNDKVKASVSSKINEVGDICNSLKINEGHGDFKITCNYLSHEITFACDLVFIKFNTLSFSIPIDFGIKITFSLDSWGPDDDSSNTDNVNQIVQQKLQVNSQPFINSPITPPTLSSLEMISTPIATVLMGSVLLLAAAFA